MREGGHGDLPTVADFADQVLRRDMRIGEEHLVERGVAVHLFQGLHFDAGLGHVDDEKRHALMLGQVPVGAREHQPPFGVVRAGGPQFLAVHFPAFAVCIGARGCARQIGSAARLAEELTPGVFAGQHAAQEARLLLLAAMLQQRRGGQQTDTDARYADRAASLEFLFDGGQQRDRQCLSIPGAWPMRHAPPGIDQQLAPCDETPLDLPILVQPSADCGAHLLFVGGAVVGAHAVASVKAR